MKKNESDYIYLNFTGPEIENGKIDLGQAGKTLVSLDRWFKKYRKDFIKSDDKVVLRAGAIKEGSSEIQIFVDFLQSTQGQIMSYSAATAAILRTPGIKDFLSGFGKTLGEQLALKLLSKGKSLHEKDRKIEDGKVKVIVENSENESMTVEDDDWLIYQRTNYLLNGFCNLEKDREEELRVGFYDRISRTKKEVAKLTYEDTDSFRDINDPGALARRMREPFDEDNSFEVKIVGKFIDYYGLAHRYRFSFQARKSQETHGKHKILCIVENDSVSDVIELLKPHKKGNVCIFGRATKDKEGKTDKIKIQWINEDPDFNPNQTRIIN